MTRLGAKKMRERRKEENLFRERIQRWLEGGHNVNHLVIPSNIPIERANQLMEEERRKLFMKKAMPIIERVAAVTTSVAESFLEQR